ncbi:hypothetical protein GCM10010387_19250 [Streptomyces inusitatus]|uniref:Uncharacterized protein n=1 Tax=Streptomyces inusitatus TaxID=68221 RepID=A0A918PZI4_9ACTN|nr:hypothetical protein [Streptomyces inusitatus]GGZ25822.1 hypothetical protein GCM10010387_19250 [Streptomyces inusitatus]
MSDGLAVGTLAYDARARRVGVVMGECGTRCALRPPQGGREWDAAVEDVRLATAADWLSAAVAARNEISRKRRP